MEYKARYLVRFLANKEMKELFNSSQEATEIAEKIWKNKMVESTVSVRLLNGDEFFIY